MSDAAELEARHLLLSMQDRLARDPHEGLGIGTASTPAEIRSAFLELTKTYHPARFGRMSHDVQRLANEVFLALRGAHDTLAKPARPPARPSPVSVQPHTQTGRMGTAPIVSRTSTGPNIARTSTGPIQRPTQPSIPTQPERPAPLGASGRPTPSSTTPPVTIAGSGPRPSPIQPAGSGATRMPTGQVPTLQPRTITPPAPAPTSAIPTTRAAHTSVGTSTARPAAPVGNSGPQRVQTQAVPTTVGSSNIPSNVKFATGAVPTTPRAPSPSGPQPAAAAPPSTARPNEPELAPVHDLIARGQWDAARVNLQALLARQPASPRYHSLISFVRGRKAQLENRLDEARAELARALQLDPELAIAKAALAELFARRR